MNKIKDASAMAIYLIVAALLVRALLSFGDPWDGGFVLLEGHSKLDRDFVVVQIEGKFGYEFSTRAIGSASEVLEITGAPYCDDEISFLPEPFHGLMVGAGFKSIECHEGSFSIK